LFSERGKISIFISRFVFEIIKYFLQNMRKRTEFKGFFLKIGVISPFRRKKREKEKKRKNNFIC